jgi:hypothetical protein
LAALLLTDGPAFAHTVRQELGAYQDNQGLSRQRIGYDVTVDGPQRAGAGLTSSTFDLTARRDFYNDTSVVDSDYDREVYGGGRRTGDSAALTATQTWDRLTETRVLGAFSSDLQVESRTWGVGASTWGLHETLRLSVDLSRTVTDQPEFRFLDFDSKQVGNPPLTSSTGVSLGVRHLATPTTIVDYGAGQLVNDTRPPSSTGQVAIRQFVPPVSGALHVAGTRAYNRGYISTDTTYGQVDAWTLETAWLQNLWRGALARLGYRYYKEDETTRAYADEKVFGSDTVSLGMSQELPKGATFGLTRPLTLEASAARYLTNVDIAATSFELGLAARF